MNHTISDVAAELEKLVRESTVKLAALDEEAGRATRGPGTWSRKQILGHVIDSALNNVHRFVRAQKEKSLIFPDYDQPFWVDRGRYQERSWISLVRLWELLNQHLVYVIAGSPEDRLATSCIIGGSEPLTLGFIVRDYVVHLRHHLQQILDPEGAPGKSHPPRTEPKNRPTGS
jgi:hypothetical protein